MTASPQSLACVEAGEHSGQLPVQHRLQRVRRPQVVPQRARVGAIVEQLEAPGAGAQAAPHMDTSCYNKSRPWFQKQSNNLLKIICVTVKGVMFEKQNYLFKCFSKL